MASTPTLRQLQYFIAIAETASFRRAAARLRTSQPTLTSQIAALENGLSVQLFERSRAGTSLTQAGRELLARARRVAEEYQGLVDQAQSLSRGPVGTYRLGVTPTLGPYLLPQVLSEIHRKYGALKLFVREGVPRVLEGDLIAGDHDLILTTLPISAGDLVVAPLFREPLRLVMSSDHPLASRARILPADLRDEPVLTLEEHHLFHRQIEQLCHRLGARILRDYEGTSLDTLRQMVVLGMGVAFLPSLYVRSEIRPPEELHVTSIVGERMERLHALAWRPTSPSHALFQALADDIRRVAVERLSQEVAPVR